MEVYLYSKISIRRERGVIRASMVLVVVAK